MINLLQIIQTIIQAYSHLSMKQLFQNYLTVNILVISNASVAKEFFRKNLFLTKSKEQLFFRSHQLKMANQMRSTFQSGNNKSMMTSTKSVPVYIALNHPKLLPLHLHLFGIQQKQQKSQYKTFRTIQNLICITKDNEILDNILAMDQKAMKILSHKEIKGIFLCVQYQNQSLQDIQHHISIFLSISQLFHSHIGLVLSINPVHDLSLFVDYIKLSEKEFDEQEDSILVNSSYARIFQALPFKIKYDQIASLGQIQVNYWGQIVRIQQGIQGIIFWFMFNHIPILFTQQQGKQKTYVMPKISQKQQINAQKVGLKLSEQNYGHILMRQKKHLTEAINDLQLTIVIININKSQYCLNIDKIFNSILQTELNRFRHTKNIVKDIVKCQKIDNQVSRLCELLEDIQIKRPAYIQKTQPILQRQDRINKSLNDLSYQVNKWLIIN